MNATTPPKLMPPFHSTTASGTFPMEQTNEAIATSGPMMGPHSLDASGWPSKKNVRQNESGTQAAMAPAMSRPITRSRRIAAHSMTNTWLVEVNPSRENKRRARDPSRCTDVSIAACPSIGDSAFGLLAGLTQERVAQEQPEQDCQHDDHDGPADELRCGELPAHQQGEDDAELDDEVGGSDLEGHRGGEVRAFTEQ